MRASSQGAAGYRNRLDESEGYMAIKMSLDQVLKREYSAHFPRIIFERCKVATRFQCLASLLFLFRCNSAVDNADDDCNDLQVLSRCEQRHLIEQNGIQIEFFAH